mmetsp:Transcript_1962/g.3670  ORF Transcript_1962/g.3670 Transcript_1962/m.3670 type:complete len:204 (-) Transcript_1962:931-1542(-)
MTRAPAAWGTCAVPATLQQSFSIIRISSRSDSAISCGVAPVASIVPLRTHGRSFLFQTSLSKRRTSQQRSSLPTGSRRSGAQLEVHTTGKAASMPIPTETGAEHRFWATRAIRAHAGAVASPRGHQSSITACDVLMAFPAPWRTVQRSSSTIPISTRRAPAVIQAAAGDLFARLHMVRKIRTKPLQIRLPKLRESPSQRRIKS